MEEKVSLSKHQIKIASLKNLNYFSTHFTQKLERHFKKFQVEIKLNIGQEEVSKNYYLTQ